jgi:lipopolysaccharide/colanic/teichoic acid biosynthesis glycosyltransferase
MRPSRLPSTKSGFRYRLFAFDAVCAISAPIAALLLRNPTLFERSDLTSIITYTVVSFGFCVVSFIGFRLADSVPQFFSHRESLETGKAALVGVAAAAIFTFSVTRLDDIPRSVPAVHLLLLVTALNLIRLLHRNLAHRRNSNGARLRYEDEENVIVVGANKLAWFYVQMLDTLGVGNRRIVGILDDDTDLHGRSIFGHVVLGSPSEAHSLVHDFGMHGTPISRFVVCERDRERALHMVAALEPICLTEEIELELLAEQLGIPDTDLHAAADTVSPPIRETALRTYFRTKRLIDFAVSFVVIITLLPLFAVIAALIFAESGPPVLFWQRRVGREGRSIFVYKFRTMLKPIDRHGRRLNDAERRSRLGNLLRATRLDELPQLFNVLNGSMSLIGPRPLLPIDQPAGETERLLVAPGITGWAQVHGGNLISPEEKRVLDDFYVNNASFRLDLLIFWRTIMTVVAGDTRRQTQLKRALHHSMISAQAPASD